MHFAPPARQQEETEVGVVRSVIVQSWLSCVLYEQFVYVTARTLPYDFFA